MTVYGQDAYAVRLEWGQDGVRELADCTVLIIVDVLVFTTSVDVALGRGGRVLPLPWQDERADEAARQAGAVLARPGLRRTPAGLSASADGAAPWTLRPSSLVDLPASTFLAIASLNGATLCAAAADTGALVLAGCLRNAAAVAAAARKLAGDKPIGVIPAGERWLETNGRGLRPSVEELLGAGAIVHALGGSGRSPEAEVAALVYAAARGRVRELLAGCVSGRELTGAGLSLDVELAGDLDRSEVVPILVNGAFEPWRGKTR